MSGSGGPAVTRGQPRLGVNIDHVATLRQARRVAYPDPLEAARMALEGGADGITIHLREDRRHIQDADVERLRGALRTNLNLEIAVTDAMVAAPHELERIAAAAGVVRALGLDLHAGHGLTVANVGPVARVPGMAELNIGHSIVARAVLVGMVAAVREMKAAVA
jgi:pyridoxine 5'-phosphate synthase PdxJ